MHYVLGVPVIVLTTLVGTSVFASLSTQPDPRLQITTGIASVVAAVLAALQTFLGHSDRAEKHRLAGAKYGALGRQLEELLSTGADISNLPKIREWLDALAIEYQMYHSQFIGKRKYPFCKT